MEPLAVALMIVAGATAGVVIAFARRRLRPEQSPGAAPTAGEMAVSLAFPVLRAGQDEAAALAEARFVSDAAVRRNIEGVSWGEAFVRFGGRDAAYDLLDLVAAILARRRRPLNDAQYFALLDLCFALGFYGDTMSRVMETRGLRRAPAPAGGRGREALPADAAMRVLGLSGRPSRGEIVAAYRRAARAAHPDRFHEASEEERRRAADRFIAVVRAAETLLERRD